MVKKDQLKEEIFYVICKSDPKDAGQDQLKRVADFMKKYRRHAIVVILIIGAIITPTGDPFTLALVSVPIYLLWELSILIVKHTER